MAPPTNMHNNSETNQNNEMITLEEFLIQLGVIQRSDISSSQQEIMPRNVVDHNGPIMNTTTNVQTTQENQMGYNFHGHHQSNVVMNNMQQGSFYMDMNNVQQRSTIAPNFGCFNGGLSIKDYCEMVEDDEDEECDSKFNMVGNGSFGVNVVGSSLREENMIKRQQRMVKNREAAIRSRERRKAYVDALEEEIKQLKEENAELKLLLAEVTKERNTEEDVEEQSTTAGKTEEGLQQLRRFSSV